MTTSTLATFAPNDVSIILNHPATGISHTVSGYAQDSIVTVERDTEAFAMHTGADNTATRIYMPNTSGKITISLAQTSNSNDVLTWIYNYDLSKLNAQGLFSITVKDNSGRSTFYSAQSYIAIIPHSAFGTSMQNREWVIHGRDLQMALGGNNPFNNADASAVQALCGAINPAWAPSGGL